MWGALKTLVTKDPHEGDRVLTVVIFALMAATGTDSATARLTEPGGYAHATGILFLLLALAALAVLIREVLWQGGRSVARWTRSDTTNVIMVGALGAAILLLNARLPGVPTVERTSGFLIAALYLALAVTFAAMRRRTLRALTA
jgi:hypothetical protein